MQKYSATIQYTDPTKEPGYREHMQEVIVSADSTDGAFDAARSLQQHVSSVHLHGFVMGPYFDGPSWLRYYPISA
jgi:hypothetical protein